METAVAIARIEQALESHDDRIKSIHGRVGEVQVQQSDQQTQLKVLGKEVEEARSDIGEVRRQIGALSDHIDTGLNDTRQSFDIKMTKVQEGFDDKFETLTGAVRWGTGALIAAIGIMVPIVLQIH